MDSATQILDIAERRMRQTGYNAVSYRDIAAEMGIKSASLHYHFPKKEDLGAALTRRYSKNFSGALHDISSRAPTPEARIKAFVDILTLIQLFFFIDQILFICKLTFCIFLIFTWE